TTLDGHITSWNEGATRIYGYDADEMIGQSISRIIPPELQGEEKQIFARLRRGGRMRPYETVRLAKVGRRVDVSLSVSPLCDGAGNVVGASKIARDITERRHAEKTQRLVIEELNHRVKNTLATVQAIANQSLRRAKSPSDFVESFMGRVQALAKANTLLAQAKMQGAELTELVRGHVPLGLADDPRISFSGPLVSLDAQLALHMAMVLHELATNARKYGALSVADGRLTVRWKVQVNGERRLVLEWEESGGPTVTAPSAHGFGTTLIEQTLRSHGGEARIHYRASGVTCEIG